MSEISNQLKSQTLGDVSASSFGTVGGRVFPDLGATADFLDLIKIVDAYRATHNPNYGTHIPGSGAMSFQEGAAGINTFKDLAAPTDDLFLPKKTYKLLGMSVTNLGSGSLSVDCGITNGSDFIKLSNVSPGGGAENNVDMREFNTFESKVQPAFIVTSGTPADAYVQIAYAELTQ